MRRGRERPLGDRLQDRSANTQLRRPDRPDSRQEDITALDAEIERFDLPGAARNGGLVSRFAGLDDAVETSLGFDEVVELVETALKEGELIQLPPDETKRVLNPQQIVTVERM